MALISEVAEKIYEIKPEGQGHEIFPLCTVYLVVDNKTALIEVGSSIQIPDILDAVGRLGYDIKRAFLYHPHPRSFRPCRRGRPFSAAAAPCPGGGPPQGGKVPCRPINN
jgi:hypothetical protein